MIEIKLNPNVVNLGLTIALLIQKTKEITDEKYFLKFNSDEQLSILIDLINQYLDMPDKYLHPILNFIYEMDKIK